MTISELWQQILISIIGGIAAELLHWYTLARSRKPVEQFAKNSLYWFTSIAMILLGGLMPVLYISGSASALLCFHLGASTPLILAKLISQVPQIQQSQGRKKPTQPEFHDFISW